MQDDDSIRAPETAATQPLSIDMNYVQDSIEKLTRDSSKIKGINKSRIDADILEDDITTLLGSTRLILSREASVELLKFIKFKVSTGKLSKNYFRVFKTLLGENAFTDLIDGKMSDDDRFDILSKCVYRLIQKRPLVFYGVEDTAVYRDGKGNTDHNDFVNVANDSNALIEYISYSELEFSRRLAVSALTHLYKFTGTGYDKLSAHPILIHAHSGIRLERPETPEYKKLVVSESRNPELLKSIKVPGLLGSLKKQSIGCICPGNTPPQEFMLLQETPRLFINLTLYKSMLRELFENYLADSNRAGVQSQKEVHLRLMPIDLTDTNYSIAGISGNEKAVLSALASVHREVLKLIADQQDFVKKYPRLFTIELRQSFWEDGKYKCENPIVTYRKYSVDDNLAELTESIPDAAEKGSTKDTLLCVNMVCSPNAYAGNRIYKNSLSSIEAEFANRSNITTLFNPLFNPAIIGPSLLNTLLIRFPSGKLSSLTEIKQTLIQAAQISTEHTATDQPAPAAPPTQTTLEIEPALEVNVEKKPAAPKAKINPFVKLKPFFAGLSAFFILIADIFRHMKAALIEMINARRK